MNAAERGPVRPLELRRGTDAVIELIADGRRVAVPADDRTDAEIRRAARAERFRWQLEVAGP